MTSPNTMTDAVRNAVLYQLSNIHTAMPAVIVSYDYTTKKAQVQPTVQKKYIDDEVQPMPLINDVPVVFPFCGGASLTFPVLAGDPCLIICCERSIDVWMQDAEQAPPNDPRKFDLSDAVAIMGLVPFNETSPAENNSDVLLTYKGSKIIIRENGDILIDTASKVAIGNSTVELIQQLCDLLQSLITNLGGAAPYPGVVADATTILANLNTIKGTI